MNDIDKNMNIQRGVAFLIRNFHFFDKWNFINSLVHIKAIQPTKRVHAKYINLGASVYSNNGFPSTT